MILQLAFVLTAIIIGARLGGIGLGVMGGVGLAILTFVFGLQPTAPPIDVMLMIAAVISAASCMQAAGGLDYMVKLAEHLLRKNPSHVTLLSPLVTYLFTFVAGTGHVAYSVLPVIAEVATETKIRPERPLGIAVIASQQAITASPISAATVALLGLLAGFDITLFDILKITIPATIIGVLVGALFSMRIGKELVEDPEYQKRLKEGLFNNKKVEIKNVKNKRSAMISVIIFILATAFIVLFGSFEGMRPSFLIDGEIVTLEVFRNISWYEYLFIFGPLLFLGFGAAFGLDAAEISNAAAVVGGVAGLVFALAGFFACNAVVHSGRLKKWLKILLNLLVLAALAGLFVWFFLSIAVVLALIGLGEALVNAAFLP